MDSEGSVEDSQPDEEPSSLETEPLPFLPVSINPSNITPAMTCDRSLPKKSLVGSPETSTSISAFAQLTVPAVSFNCC